MIIGVGTDLCHVEQIRRSLRRIGDLWVDHLFTDDERRLYSSHTNPTLLLAQGFCGKEACAKALGTGIADGIEWRQIEVLYEKPRATLRLSGEAQDRLTAITPANH